MNSTIKHLLTSRRTATVLAVGTVAGVAGYASYGHQYDVATMAHQSAALAAVFPLSVDGMLLAASLAIAEDKASGRRPRLWATVAFWLGAAVSVSANIASVTVHWGLDPLAIAVSAWPPLALLITVEVLSRKGRLEKNPNRVEGARRGAATRAAKKSTKRPARTRKPVSAPVSPGHGPVSAPSVAEVVEATR
jgi:hypothetical protein